MRGKVGRGDSGTAMCGGHAQPLPLEDLDDLSGEHRLKLVHIRVLAPEIAEDIATSAHEVHTFPFHRNISFSFPRRFWIRSISRFGVLTAWVDFF